MSNQHGGQRPNAGRHTKTAFEISLEPQTPMEWLWKALIERYGQVEIDEIHRQFNRVNQVYQKRRLQVQRAYRSRDE
ncbi:MAG: hypothetical protein ABI324_21590 [Ktedonobacteraceae bacterium]